jgi:hypothetical protein
MYRKVYFYYFVGHCNNMINKKTPLFALFFLLIGQAHSQYLVPQRGPNMVAVAPTLLSAYKSVIIRLPGIRDSGEVQVPGYFNHFEVVDDRMDTTRIGVHSESFGILKYHTRQLVFSRPAAAELADYLNGRYANRRSSCSALVVIRNLWLSDASYLRDELTTDPDKRLDRTKVRIRVEIYGRQDSVYIPLLRYDSLVISRTDSYKEYRRNLAGMLDDLADSSSLIAQKKMGGGRKLKWDDILQFNASRSEAPISHSAALTKGVYKDFAEFKNNAPSISDFEVKKEKNEMILYLKEAGDQSYYTHNAWGYCDGNNVFVMREGALYPAWKEGSAWYLQQKVTLEVNNPGPVLPPTYITGPSTGPSSYTASGLSTPGIPYNNTRRLTLVHVLAVDMDNGALY